MKPIEELTLKQLVDLLIQVQEKQKAMNDIAMAVEHSAQLDVTVQFGSDTPHEIPALSVLSVARYLENELDVAQETIKNQIRHLL